MDINKNEILLEVQKLLVKGRTDVEIKISPNGKWSVIAKA